MRSPQLKRAKELGKNKLLGARRPSFMLRGVNHWQSFGLSFFLARCKKGMNAPTQTLRRAPRKVGEKGGHGGSGDVRGFPAKETMSKTYPTKTCPHPLLLPHPCLFLCLKNELVLKGEACGSDLEPPPPPPQKVLVCGGTRLSCIDVVGKISLVFFLTPLVSSYFPPVKSRFGHPDSLNTSGVESTF